MKLFIVFLICLIKYSKPELLFVYKSDFRLESRCTIDLLSSNEKTRQEDLTTSFNRFWTCSANHDCFIEWTKVENNFRFLITTGCSKNDLIENEEISVITIKESKLFVFKQCTCSLDQTSCFCRFFDKFLPVEQIKILFPKEEIELDHGTIVF